MDQLALEFKAPPQFREPLEAFLASKQAENVTPRTLQTYREVLEPFIAWLGLHGIWEITPDAARRYVLYQQTRNLADATIESRARIVKVFGNWLTNGQFQSFKVPRASQSVGRTLEEHEVNQLLEAAPNKRDRALIAVMAATGARLGEVERMKWADLRDAYIVLPMTKARKPRIVGLDPRTLEYLRLYKVMANDHPQRAMWQKLSNLDDISAAGIRAVIKKVARIANVPNVTPHSFRRFFATAALGKGMPVESLRRLLGHSSYAMVRRYASLSDQHLLSDYGRYGPFSKREDSDEE